MDLSRTLVCLFKVLSDSSVVNTISNVKMAYVFGRRWTHICFWWFIKLEIIIPGKTLSVLSFSRTFQTVPNCYIKAVFELQIITFIWYCLTKIHLVLKFFWYCVTHIHLILPYCRSITTVSIYNGTSSDIIAQWIKKKIEDIVINSGIFSSNGCRSASTSKILASGVSVSTILESTSSSTDSTRYFKRYYLKVILEV